MTIGHKTVLLRLHNIIIIIIKISASDQGENNTMTSLLLLLFSHWSVFKLVNEMDKQPDKHTPC